MNLHYSQKYCVQELIHKYCTKEWKFLMYENSETHYYDAGVTVFKEGDQANTIDIILTGRAKVHTSISPNKDNIVRLATDKQVLGHRSFGGDFYYSVSATTLSESKILHIPIHIFMDLLKANNAFCFHFMMFFAEELKSSERHFKLVGTSNLNQRVAAAILDNIVAFGYSVVDKNTLNFTLSRKDYADMANTSYESIIRIFKIFSDEGIIKIKGKELEILDENRLIEISKLEY